MDIESLANGLYEDSNGLTTCVRLEANGDLVLNLECDDWEGAERRRHFAITCKGHIANDVCVGSVSVISLHHEHPLLLERVGRQGALYFSSGPIEPDRVFREMWDALAYAYSGWVAPSQAIGHSPSSFRALLNGGYGLLLRGPMSVLENVRSRLGDAIVTQLIETHVAKSESVVLVVEDHFVICGAVEVAENGV